MADKDDKPKIVVDDDYKKQAQAEKEKLAHEVEAPSAEGGAGGAEGKEIPPASFTTLVGSVLTQVFMALGGYEDPRTKRRYIDLELAKHYVDTLSILEEKTRNNLSEDEKKLMDRSLYEARMQYVQIAQAAVKI